RDVLPAQQVGAAVEAVEQAEHVHQRRLAAAAGAHQRHQFALVDVEADALQGLELAALEAVGLAHVAQRDDGGAQRGAPAGRPPGRPNPGPAPAFGPPGRETANPGGTTRLSPSRRSPVTTLSKPTVATTSTRRRSSAPESDLTVTAAPSGPIVTACMGTRNAPRTSRTTISDSAVMPGLNARSALSRRIDTSKIGMLLSRRPTGETALTTPSKVLPGTASRVTYALCPVATSAISVSSICTTSTSRESSRSVSSVCWS